MSTTNNIYANLLFDPRLKLDEFVHPWACPWQGNTRHCKQNVKAMALCASALANCHTGQALCFNTPMPTMASESDQRSGNVI